MYSPPTLTTKRLILRPWKESDLDAFAALNADRTVMEFFPAPLTRQQSDEFARKIQEEFSQRGYGLWAIEIPGKASFIGFTGLHLASFKAPFTPCVEIGWRLARPYWGQGYATEAAEEALRFGFIEMGLEEIVSFTSEKNLRSQKIMQRLGMKRDPEEDFLHPALAEDHPLATHVLYRLSKTMWAAQRSSS